MGVSQPTSLKNNPRNPHIADDFRSTFVTVRELPWDLLLTALPSADGWQYTSGAVQSEQVDCRAYADAAEEKFEKQLAAESH